MRMRLGRRVFLSVGLLIGYFAIGEVSHAQNSLSDMLTQNCQRDIDQCYSDAGNRFVSVFRGQIRGNVSAAQQATIDSIDIQVVQNRSVLDMVAFVDGGGRRRIEMSSASLFSLHVVSTAAVLGILHGSSDDDFDRYLRQLVANLVVNTQRMKLGQPPVATRTFAQTVGIDEKEEGKLMDTDQGRGLTGLFFQMQFLWILAHEIGHHVLGHVPRRAALPADQIRKQEHDADLFATQLLIKMGYSTAPMVSGMTYFASIEKFGSDGVEDKTHPPAGCRLADVLELARDTYASIPPRDNLNHQLNDIVIGNAMVPAFIGRLRAANGGCKI